MTLGVVGDTKTTMITEKTRRKPLIFLTREQQDLRRKRSRHFKDIEGRPYKYLMEKGEKPPCIGREYKELNKRAFLFLLHFYFEIQATLFPLLCNIE